MTNRERDGRTSVIFMIVFVALCAWLDRPVAYGYGMLTASSFASLYKTSNEAVNCVGKGTYYEVPTWTVGVEHNADGQTDGDIAITRAGTYFVTSSTSFDGVAGDEYDWCLHIDGVEMPGMEAENTAKTASGLSVAACSVATYCAVGYVLDMRVADNSGTGTVNLRKGMFTAMRVGP